MRPRLLHPLDRYVFSEWTRIFLGTAIGFPILVIIIDLTDNLQKYLGRNLSREAILLSYVYWIPDSMFMALPAAVLFATVFTIGALTRHSEITAAKASGISFYRLTIPIFVGAAMASVLTLAVGELVPITSQRREQLLEERRVETQRYNFAYAAERGRVYKLAALNADRSAADAVEIERKGRGRDYPTYVLTAESGHWTPRHGWVLRRGNLHVMPTNETDVTFSFDSVRERRMGERPSDLLTKPRSPHEMGYQELRRFIAALERSGGDVNELKVEQALKLSVPVTCLIIALFGAPLATSTQRGGAAYGVGISLGTTIVFLIMIQLTKAVGGHGLLSPQLAAWIPNGAFGVVGLGLLARVRT